MYINFETTDIVLAATLPLYQHKLTNITINGQRGTFHFENIPDELIQNYELGQCLVEPIAMNNNIKRLTTSVRRLAGQTK